MKCKLSSGTLVFLGAGASAPFDIPDAGRLLDEVQNKLTPYTNRIKQVRKNIKHFGLTDDIEAVLSVLNFWSNPTKVIVDAGPFLSEMLGSKISDFGRSQRDAKIALRVKEYIARRCFVRDPDITSLIVDVYSNFLSALGRKFDIPECAPAGHSSCPAVEIFTTNYDNVVEEFCRKNGNYFYDGYREYLGRHYFFDPKPYESFKALGVPATYVRLYKLHGTVTYGRMESDGTIDRISLIPSRGPLVIGGQTAFPDLIYPGIQTCLAREPQLELLSFLKDRLSSASTCVVVGYRFGDPHIRQIFSDALARNRLLRVFIVSRNASTTKKERLADSDRFIPVSKHFEKFKVEEDLDG